MSIIGNRRLIKEIRDLFVVSSLEVFLFVILMGFLGIRSMILSLVLIFILAGFFYGLHNFSRVKSYFYKMIKNHRGSAFFIAILLIGTFPFFFRRDPYLIHILLMCEIYALVAVGLNFQFGSLGCHSFGFAAFYGIGAYTSALVAVKCNISFWLGMPMGGLVAALLGILLGLPTLKTRAFYYALITLAFGIVFHYFIIHWDWAGGTNGVVNIPSPSIGSYSFENSLTLFGMKLPHHANFFYLTLAFLILGIIAGDRLYNSGIGLAWNAIFEDEIMAECQGINVPKLKLIAFALGSFYAGVAGAIRAHYVGFISPETFFVNVSIFLVCVVVLGGSDNVLGAVLGAVVLTIVPEKFRGFGELRMLMYGVVIILVLFFLPEGLLPKKVRKYSGFFEYSSHRLI